MRRLLYIIMCLTCSMLARAQSTYTYRYWFDDDDSHAVVTETGNRLKVDISMDGLTETLHSLHLQVADEKGVASSPQTALFVKGSTKAEGVLKYWFDENTAAKSTIDEGASFIDVTHLSDGLHTLHVQKESSAPSAIKSSMFIKVSSKKDFTDGFRYWFDHDDAYQKTLKGMTILTKVDVSNLSDGLHMLHVQATGNAPSTTHSTFFLKTPQVVGVEKLLVVSSIDGMMYKQEKVPANGGILHYDFDASGLSEGIHLFSAQVVSPSGVASSVCTSYFLRVNTAEEVSRMKCFYSVDGQPGYAQAGEYSAGTFHFDVDVANLTNGLHRIAYMLVTESGTATSMRSAFFIKTPLGGNGISSYEYWLNTDYANCTQKRLDGHPLRLSLMSLLPVPSAPLRSSDFHFEFKNGKPYIYAQNDFHIRFFEASGRFTDQCASFTDYNVGQEVKGAQLLVSGQPVTKTKPAENDIQWYHFPAQIGDSLSFKVDRACTVQVFAPSGKEVYKASASDVVKWDGCHAWEDGEYYLALHDVTAQQGTTTRLEYLHIDKYAILTTDILVVGTGSVSTIGHKGNGFDYLTSITLVNNETGDEIKAFSIEHLSDNEIRATYDLNNALIGTYSQKFQFDKEERINPHNIRIEEMSGIQLSYSVKYPSRFLRGTNSTYTVSITNHGNMSAYNIPIYAYIATETDEGIQKITIEGLNLPKFIDSFDLSDLDNNEISVLKQVSEEIGDSHYFLVQRAWNEDIKDSVTVRSNYFFTEIKPRETKTIKFNIQSTEIIHAWFTLPNDWNPIHIKDNDLSSYANKVMARSAKESYCCIREKVECAANITAYVGTLANIIGKQFPGTPAHTITAITSCAADALSTTIQIAGYVMCDDNSVEKSFWDKVHYALTGNSVVSVICGCFEKWIPGGFSLIGDVSQFVTLISHPVGVTDCIKSMGQKVPNCPPNPPNGGSSNPVNSMDPNDITGYTAESGVKFIKKDLVDVDYKIEFENDTTLATASAHVVVVKDTLDSKRFDLSSFTPTSVKIGDKLEMLDGSQNFIKTIDMRPEIDAITQVEGRFDKTQGIAIWTFTSLDPMTMEPTDDIMQGFLPVNYDGRGQGEVTFDIKLKDGLADGTEISNRASIVFDSEDAIMTPTWTNIIDAVPPTSSVVDIAMKNDTTATIFVEGEDARSGVWRYDLYVQYGEGTEWVLAVQNVDTTAIDLPIYDGVDYGFCVLATDSAGNREVKTIEREMSIRKYMPGDANTDAVVDLQDAVLIVQYFIEAPDTYLNASAADYNGDGNVDVQDAVAIVNLYVSTDSKHIRKRLNIKQQ